MSLMVQIDIEPLYEHHVQLLRIVERLEDLSQEAGPAEREVAETLRTLAQRMLDQIEDVLDSEESRAAMEDVRLHGAIPWEEVEAQLGR